MTAAAPDPATWAEMAREVVIEEARRAGVDPQELFGAVIALDLPGPDRTQRVTFTVAQFLDAYAGAPASDEAGSFGLPETMVGATLHVYLNIVFLGSALAYKVHDSALVPPTPPVVLPPPATLQFFDAGGPLRNVKGSYLLGGHTTGTVLGSNVDTGASGPYLPLVSSGLVLDNRIDFLGHALVVQGQVCIIFTLVCIAVGLLLGDGVALWDTSDPSLPEVP